MIKIGTIPSLYPVLIDKFSACEQKIRGVVILVNVHPNQALHTDHSDIIFQIGTLGLDGNTFLYQVGLAEIVIIAHPALIIDTLDSDLVSVYYTTPQTNIQPWTYPHNHELRLFFDNIFLKSGEPSPTVHIAPGPIEMNEAISNNPNAIGYTLRPWLTEGVQEISLSTTIQDSLTQPILAVTNKNPQGIVKEFLACVQSSEP